FVSFFHRNGNPGWRKQQKHAVIVKIVFIWIWASLISMAVNCQNSENRNGNEVKSRSASLDLEPSPGEEILTVAGGCFWCVEEVFERTKGVSRAISGYAGGHTKNPTYEESNTGQTGHAEAVQIYYDPDSISFGQLLQIFFLAAHDPTRSEERRVGKECRARWLL